MLQTEIQGGVHVQPGTTSAGGGDESISYFQQPFPAGGRERVATSSGPKSRNQYIGI